MDEDGGSCNELHGEEFAPVLAISANRTDIHLSLRLASGTVQKHLQSEPRRNEHWLRGLGAIRFPHGCSGEAWLSHATRGHRASPLARRYVQCLHGGGDSVGKALLHHVYFEVSSVVLPAIPFNTPCLWPTFRREVWRRACRPSSPTRISHWFQHWYRSLGVVPSGSLRTE